MTNHLPTTERVVPNLLGALVGVSCIFFSALGWAQPPAGPNGYDYGAHMMWGGGWYGMFLGPFFLILLLVGVIAAVALMSRWFAGPWHGPATSHHHVPMGRSPLDILKERYAKGEIDKEEFEERRRVLGE